jgi:DNA polymerase III epsilon subunit
LRQVVIAIETTGTESTAENRVIEIGCVELINEKLTGNYFHVYLNPECTIDFSDSERHGLTSEFLIDKPKFSDAGKELLDFLDDDELVTYNANFLLPLLRHEIELSGITSKKDILNNDITDVLKIGNERHPNQKNSLQDLCKRYYVDISQTEFTGALFRAEIIADLYIALMDEDTKKITSDLNKYHKGDNLVVVESFSDLDNAIEGIGRSALCRGVSNHEYPLLPSLFRHNDVDSADIREQKLMWVFKTHAKPLLKSNPENELEWLAIAQHHGLPTRLLDWSLSPLIACFFAVQSLSKSDGAIYIYDIGQFKKEEEIDPSNLDDIVAFLPSHATNRVTAQSGMFTIHPTKKMKLESESIKKIVIPAKRKKYFMEKLVKYGVHAGIVFPNLDGLSSYLSYLNGYR